MEEWLVAGYVLNAHDAGRTHGDDLINQLHWVAMRQELADADVIHDWLLVWIVDRSLDFVLADLLAHETGELVVHGVARTGCNDATLIGLPMSAISPMMSSSLWRVHSFSHCNGRCWM